jgi:acyl carrier protein
MDNMLNILKEIRPEADFENCSDFIEEGLLDSLDVIKLTSMLDNTFSISIEGEDIVPENYCSIEAMKKLVQKYKGESP